MLVARHRLFPYALAAALTTASPGARAQTQEFSWAGGGQAGNSLVMILMAPAVQQELKLDDGQKAKVYEVARDAGQKSREFYQSVLRSGAANPQTILAAAGQFRHEIEKSAMASLKSEQKSRAEQILLQVEGPLAIARPEIAARLGLSPQQTQQVQMTALQASQALRQSGQARGGAASVREAATRQLGRVLDAKQKKAFNEMLGEPFDLAKIDPALASAPDPKSTAADEAGSTPRKGSGARKKRGTTTKKSTEKPPSPA